jgi:hypothetical protein
MAQHIAGPGKDLCWSIRAAYREKLARAALYEVHRQIKVGAPTPTQRSEAKILASASGAKWTKAVVVPLER